MMNWCVRRTLAAFTASFRSSPVTLSDESHHRLRMRRRAGLLIGCIVTAMVPGVGQVEATLFAEAEVQDPFSEGKCSVHQWMSYGSYIFDYPSKFDGIYWPFTEEEWIWFCPRSGYTSFGDDFEDLSESERGVIAEFLSTHYRRRVRPTDSLSRLILAEQIYRLRDKDTRFWAWFYRLMTYWYSKEGHPLLADVATRRALPLIEEVAATIEPGPSRIQHLFLAGEYHRRLGHLDEAVRFFHEARQVKWIDAEGEEQVGDPYFDQLITESESLLAGTTEKAD